MAEIFAGSRAAVILNGKPLLLCSGLEINVDNRLEEIPQLDTLTVAEYAENGHRINFSVNVFKTLAHTARAFGLETVDPRDLTLNPDMLFQVLDDFGNEVFMIYGVRFQGGSGTLDARGLWVGRWNFVGVRGHGL